MKFIKNCSKKSGLDILVPESKKLSRESMALAQKHSHLATMNKVISGKMDELKSQTSVLDSARKKLENKIREIKIKKEKLEKKIGEYGPCMAGMDEREKKVRDLGVELKNREMELSRADKDLRKREKALKKKEEKVANDIRSAAELKKKSELLRDDTKMREKELSEYLNKFQKEWRRFKVERIIFFDNQKSFDADYRKALEFYEKKIEDLAKKEKILKQKENAFRMMRLSRTDTAESKSAKLLDAKLLMKDAKAKGYSKKQIMAGFREKGWPDKLIKEIIK